MGKTAKTAKTNQQAKTKSKEYSLTKDEQARLAQIGEIHGALSSWQNLLDYLGKLVEQDRQLFVNEVVRPRLNLPNQTTNQPDIRIDVPKGKVVKLDE